MVRHFTCIMCPMGCELTAETEDGTGQILVAGNSCPKGKEYAVQELTDPRRSIASSVLVEGGELPLVSVRLDRPIPRGRISEVMEQIKKQRLAAPVEAGQVVIENVLGLQSNLITTKYVGKSSPLK